MGFFRQRSLNRAELANWTKGYKCSGVEGVDVGLLLKQSLEKRPRLKIQVQIVGFSIGVGHIHGHGG